VNSRFAPGSIKRRRLERGGAAAIVAVLLGGGVLLGASALTLDVGSIMLERRQLQNGADAAAVALASTCASNPTACTTTSPVIATYGNANAKDGSTSNDGVCGRFSGTGFTPNGTWTQCSSATDAATQEAAKTADLGACVPLPGFMKTTSGLATPYVEVNVGTAKSGTTPSLLPGLFSKAVTGSDNPHVRACARAAWGPATPSTQRVLNIVMSECDWVTQTGYTGPGTATYPAGPTGAYPGYTTGTWPASEARVYTKGNPTSCDTSSPGGTAPGGFAALKAASTCQSDLTVGPDGKLWADGDPGNDLPCTDAQLQALLGKVLYVPLFDCQTQTATTVTAATDCSSGQGNNNVYRISGFAAFYFAGWHLSSSNQNSIRPPFDAACSGADRCLVGWFVKDVVATAPQAGAPTSGTPNYGLTGVWSVG
jgi:Flp pilus assembly protein TadG